MADIRRYDSKAVEVSKRFLLEIFALLKEYKDDLILVGGWVPYFLLEKYKSKEVEFEHIGSIDIDIALDHKRVPGIGKVYESIKQKLERNGYEIRKSKDNRPIPHSFEKEIQGTLIHVDFLASEYGGTGKQRRHQRIQDILAFKSKGIDIAFRDNEEFEIEGFLPNGAKYATKIKMSGVTAFLTMKTFAFSDDISRMKDAYDIYSILKCYKEGVTSVISEVKPYLKYKLLIEAIEKVSYLFSTIDSVGTRSLADFMLPEAIGSEDWRYYQRDVFELVQEFIEGVNS